jgi:hypothetical protein
MMGAVVAFQSGRKSTVQPDQEWGWDKLGVCVPSSFGVDSVVTLPTSCASYLGSFTIIQYRYDAVGKEEQAALPGALGAGMMNEETPWYMYYYVVVEEE